MIAFRVIWELLVGWRADELVWVAAACICGRLSANGNGRRCGACRGAVVIPMLFRRREVYTDQMNGCVLKILEYHSKVIESQLIRM